MVAADEVLGVEVESPAYCAVTWCRPVVSAEVENAAIPLTTVAVPSEVEPSRKVTVPVGVPTTAVTVADMATGSPVFELVGADNLVVLAAPAVTPTVASLLSNPALAAVRSKAYLALKVCKPTVSGG